jgi:hypothetical protein
MLTYAGSLGVKSSSSVYKIGYVREEWLKLAQSMGMYVSNTPRTHFKVCIRQRTSAYVSIRQHTSVWACTCPTRREHTSRYVLHYTTTIPASAYNVKHTSRYVLCSRTHFKVCTVFANTLQGMTYTTLLLYMRPHITYVLLATVPICVRVCYCIFLDACTARYCTLYADACKVCTARYYTYMRPRMLTTMPICVRVCYCIFLDACTARYCTLYADACKVCTARYYTLYADACSLLYIYASAYCICLGGSLRMYGSIRGRICIVGSIRQYTEGEDLTPSEPAYVSIRQHTSAYVSIQRARI